MDMYNISIDKLQKKIVQGQRNHFPYDHALSAFMKERVIVSNTRKHPAVLVDVTLAYGGETS